MLELQVDILIAGHSNKDIITYYYDRFFTKTMLKPLFRLRLEEMEWFESMPVNYFDKYKKVLIRNNSLAIPDRVRVTRIGSFTISLEERLFPEPCKWFFEGDTDNLIQRLSYSYEEMGNKKSDTHLILLTLQRMFDAIKFIKYIESKKLGIIIHLTNKQM